MEFKQLKYFVKIAELGNMTRASEALRIAQPALSQQIMNLETELGARLLDRGVYGARLTSSGEVLYGYAKSLLRQHEDVRQAVSEEVTHPTGRAAIGIPGSTGKMLAEPLVRQLLSSGGILIEIVERPSAELVDLVAAGKLDIAITVDAQPRRGARITPLFLEALYAVLPQSGVHGRQTLKLKELADSPLILPSAPSTIRHRVEAALLDKRLKFRLVSEVSATDMLIRLVAANLGWTVLPWSAISDDMQRKTGIAALPIAGHRLDREISLCVSDVLPLSRAAEVVVATTLAILKTLLADGHWMGARVLADGPLANPS
ncbi:LysR substrate-binding domain-containing protein [Cupriavidus pampae]|uniref:HTH-type transcriptional regulator CynR n=1 Tax=Cupriavidus pampae TaxID=659251 RepID=A0ABN7ZKM4_9BURK|nr:LysR substrate-binding domain-containing protein [Cupriavidus pampae]CAG9184649.1 HTH-type transcriptional regulator CynR [Cupriavidus pampae]